MARPFQFSFQVVLHRPPLIPEARGKAILESCLNVLELKSSRGVAVTLWPLSKQKVPTDAGTYDYPDWGPDPLDFIAPVSQGGDSDGLPPDVLAMEAEEEVDPVLIEELTALEDEPGHAVRNLSKTIIRSGDDDDKESGRCSSDDG